MRGHDLAVSSVTVPSAVGVDTDHSRWQATVAELVRLRREETAQEEAAEDALAAEARRVFHDRPPQPAVSPYSA